KLMTSADNRLAATSNEVRVRVESSKKRLTTVRPRSVGNFLIGRSAISASSSAVSSTSTASSRLRSAADNRCRFTAHLLRQGVPQQVDQDRLDRAALRRVHRSPR